MECYLSVFLICMAEYVDKDFGGFEGEANGFPGSGWFIRVVWVGFVGGGLVMVELVRIEGGEREMSEVSEDEEGKLLEVTEEVFESEGVL